MRFVSTCMLYQSIASLQASYLLLSPYTFHVGNQPNAYGVYGGDDSIRIHTGDIPHSSWLCSTHGSMFDWKFCVSVIVGLKQITHFPLQSLFFLPLLYTLHHALSPITMRCRCGSSKVETEASSGTIFCVACGEVSCITLHGKPIHSKQWADSYTSCPLGVGREHDRCRGYFPRA